MFSSSTFSKTDNFSSSRIHSARDQLHRKRPINTELDSEKLFQQSLSLNNQLNRLLQQNKQIKHNLHKGIRNYKQGLIFSVENVIKEKSKDFSVIKTHNDNTGNKTSSWLVYNLKKKINQINKYIELKDKQIEEFDRSKIALILRQKEAQSESLRKMSQQLFPHESPEPNDVLDELIQMRMYEQMQLQDIQELNSDISIENQKVKETLEELSVQKKELEVKKQEFQNKRKMQQMSRLSLEMERIHLESEQAQGNEEIVAELEMTRQLQTEQISSLQVRIDKIIERQSCQKRRLQAKISQLQQKLKSKQSTVGFRLQQQNPYKTEGFLSLGQKDSCSTIKHIRPNILVSELKLKDIQAIGEEIRYNLSIKRLSHADWKHLIVSDEDEETISIGELIDILEKQPFGLGEEKKRILLARYLVEESCGKYFFQETLRQKIPIVKSILQKAISSLIVYTKTQQNSLTEQVSDVTRKYSTLLIGALQTKVNKKEEVNKNEIGPVFDACSMQFSEKQMQFIVFYLFGCSQSLERLKYKNISKIGVQPLKYRQISTSSKKINEN